MFRDEWVRIFRTQWADKSAAIATAVPCAWAIYGDLRAGALDLPRAAAAIHNLLLIGTLVLRRPPVRVTTIPAYWALAVLAPYWGLCVAGFGQRGVPLAPAWVTDAISMLSLAWQVYARFSLGRSIGLVPAQRAIITRGAYRLVRHPIYTGAFVAYLAFALAAYSPLNVALLTIGCTLFAINGIVEERFLAPDRQYAAYLSRVRWRWIPGIA
ncbi:MAG: hypothetical protein HRF50_01490 [Phycisphaerae bacterium]|jgi:protein-S-isoprenylcysteine O-methyltransferase Ste14